MRLLFISLFIFLLCEYTLAFAVLKDSVFYSAVSDWCAGEERRKKATDMFGSIDDWDVSRVTNMNLLFYGSHECDPPIGKWDTSAVISMAGMFVNAKVFDQPIGNWNTSAVTDMYGMFWGASTFNQSIGKWNTAKVTDMSLMFYSATEFNQPLCWPHNDTFPIQYHMWGKSKVANWGTGTPDNCNFPTKKPTTTENPTAQPTTNKPTAQPTTKNPTAQPTAIPTTRPTFGALYDNTIKQAVRDWCAGVERQNSTRLSYGDIEIWDVSKVTNMERLLNGSKTCNPPIGKWNTTKVTNMASMFNGASEFNQPIGKWNTASVTRMDFMFTNATKFNQPIGKWNTSKVINMGYMFNNAKMFDQPICWHLTNHTFQDRQQMWTGSKVGNWGRNCVKPGTVRPSLKPTFKPTFKLTLFKPTFKPTTNQPG